ncbi:NUDIX domain-containing protein [Halomicroarcula sp. F13]|uniref:NUDIX domain-containing protein n=1 Tax=Haloarcula rubra TaxID=2487747 RepID=A0AAW4PL04_9EURY|nr:NUDIX domain-containing protein [Halomicroarcula rubra]MBX0321790.1 NUDIX domain-containing protein [Halomicroarcula rubra]
MDVSDRSRARVEERLTRLDEEFGSPSVTQTTFEVGEESYQRAVEQSRDGQLDVHAIVRDEDGAVMLREGDGEWMLPRGQTRPGENVETAAKRIVRDAAGVDCTVTDAVRANISGVRNADDEDDETVYRLSVVFTAELVEDDESAGEAVRWDSDPDAVGELV